MIHVHGDIRKEVIIVSKKYKNTFNKANRSSPIDVEPKQSLKKGIIGGKGNFKQVYVRSEPKIDSDPLTILDAGTEIQIESEANSEFYSVIFNNDQKGYCMKNCVTVIDKE